MSVPLDLCSIAGRQPVAYRHKEDPITCPECEGAGEEHIGTLTMACKLCHGRGTVGGDYEPAEGGHQRTDGYRNPIEGETYDPAVHGPLPAVQDHPAARTLTGCRKCLGTGEVINLGDIYSEKPTQLVRVPCPDCSTVLKRDGPHPEVRAVRCLCCLSRSYQALPGDCRVPQRPVAEAEFRAHVPQPGAGQHGGPTPRLRSSQIADR